MRQVLINCGSADQVIFPSVIGTRHAANCTAAASDSLPANIEDDQATSSCTAAASDSLPENPEYGIVDPADTRDEAADFLNLPGTILHDGAGYSTDDITHRQERGRSEPGEGLGASNHGCIHRGRGRSEPGEGMTPLCSSNRQSGEGLGARSYRRTCILIRRSHGSSIRWAPYLHIWSWSTAEEEPPRAKRCRELVRAVVSLCGRSAMTPRGGRQVGPTVLLALGAARAEPQTLLGGESVRAVVSLCGRLAMTPQGGSRARPTVLSALDTVEVELRTRLWRESISAAVSLCGRLAMTPRGGSRAGPVVLATLVAARARPRGTLAARLQMTLSIQPTLGMTMRTSRTSQAQHCMTVRATQWTTSLSLFLSLTLTHP